MPGSWVEVGECSIACCQGKHALALASNELHVPARLQRRMSGSSCIMLFRCHSWGLEQMTARVACVALSSILPSRHCRRKVALPPAPVLRTFAMGARQLVVQLALDTTSMVLLSYFSLFTPITNMGASLEGALMTTCVQQRITGLHATAEHPMIAFDLHVCSHSNLASLH